VSFRVPEDWRIQRPPRISRRGDLFGCFLLPASPARKIQFALRCIASDGSDWDLMQADGFVPKDSIPFEHVSVSLNPPAMTRCPTWEEMCYVKDIFWEPDDVVMQLHPPRSEWVNNHRWCLHLWKAVGIELPRPPAICVGTLK
jgi:hypothetical protein